MATAMICYVPCGNLDRPGAALSQSAAQGLPFAAGRVVLEATRNARAGLPQPILSVSVLMAPVAAETAFAARFTEMAYS
jgi:hypothetical protein